MSDIVLIFKDEILLTLEITLVGLLLQTKVLFFLYLRNRYNWIEMIETISEYL